jgi:hypothetical protein
MMGLRVEMAVQPCCGETGEPQGEGAASARAERGCATLSQQGRTERIRHH